ncbi:MAG: RNA helicase, partial [Proteobacteria bacterium]|nr:RNA helicase [Pseudomonadota bacterium]
QQTRSADGARRGGHNPNGGNGGGGGRRHDDSQPRSENAHLGTQLKHVNLGPRTSGRSAQPDPMRTSVDSMADRGRRGGGFRSGGGGGGGGGGRGPRGGGFGR